MSKRNLTVLLFALVLAPTLVCAKKRKLNSGNSSSSSSSSNSSSNSNVKRCKLNEDGLNNALRVAAQHNNAHCVEDLVACKADINGKDQSGVTPLHIAAAHGNIKVAKELIKRKANVNAKDDAGTTPIYHAAFYKKSKACELLIKYNADLSHEDLLNISIKHNISAIIKKLLSNKGEESSDDESESDSSDDESYESESDSDNEDSSGDENSQNKRTVTMPSDFSIVQTTLSNNNSNSNNTQNTTENDNLETSKDSEENKINFLDSVLFPTLKAFDKGFGKWNYSVAKSFFAYLSKKDGTLVKPEPVKPIDPTKEFITKPGPNLVVSTYQLFVPKPTQTKTWGEVFAPCSPDTQEETDSKEEEEEEEF